MKRKLASIVLLCMLTAAVRTGFAKPALEASIEQIDELVAEGFERPDRAVSKLSQMRRGSDTIDTVRVLLQATGTIQAQSGSDALAEATAEKLSSLAPQDPTGRMGASAGLVRAQIAANRDELELAATLAQTALRTFRAGCEAPLTQPRSSCDHQSLWTATSLLERNASAAGLRTVATSHAQSALYIAAAAGDERRQVINLASLALHAQERNAPDDAEKLLSESRAMALALGDRREVARVGNVEAQLRALQGDWPGAARALEAALALVAGADSPRLEATLLTTLVGINLQRGRAADALHTAERALITVRKFGDVHAERQLVAQMGLGRAMVTRSAATTAEMERTLEVWRQGGQNGTLVRMLRMSSEGLAHAGDAQGAIGLYHRERALSEQLFKIDRSAALKDLQLRNDTEAQTRQLSLIAQEKELTVAALSNRALQQRIWQILAAAMTLVMILVAVLYNQVRKTNRQLGASRIQLRSQSDRDPLTNLMNRRHFHSVMVPVDGSGGFEGTLMMIDVDHFKRVNDVHGHAAGDKVLIEVARRLTKAVQENDLVVRWGGEEFLIFAARTSFDEARLLATRVLSHLAATPIDLGQTDLWVTASIGYALFPLQRSELDIPWDQAVRLVDAAMYVAKKEGRNRAVGIVSTLAGESLDGIESSFGDAWVDGRVILEQTQGLQAQD